MKPLRLWIGAALLVITSSLAAHAQLNTNASCGRFIRGTSDYPETHSFVITLDRQLGVWLWDTGNNADWYGGVAPWCSRTARAAETNYHLDYQYTLDQSDGTSYYFEVSNPIMAFGSDLGGSPLYTNETTRLGIHFGAQLENTNQLYAAPIRILVYQRGAFSGITNNIRAMATNYISIPRRTIAADQAAWTTFVTNNETVVQTANGLRTEVRLVSGPEEFENAWGAQYTNPVVRNCAFQLSHTGLADSTNYYYVVEGTGVWMWDDTDSTSSEPLVYSDYNLTVPGWSTLYAMNFDGRPKSKIRFLDQPQFRGNPLPPDYVGKTADEWNTYYPMWTNLPPVADTSAYRALDNSPELRRHPVLDQLVSDLRNDPVALASFVVNEIALTDPMGITDQTIAPAESVNLGGINRSALAAYLERQGSPAEQCALLVYLLRQAGYPTAYVWPTNNLKLLDTTLSKLMRMQVSGAVDNYGWQYSTNALITVNWPWVATRLADGTTVHIFPWMKDTEVLEGLNLSEYLPTNYNRGYQWVTDYVYGNTNILGLSQDTDLPLNLFKQYVSLSLLTNYPGLSLDDFGVYFSDRRTRHSQWSDFAVPNEVDNQDKLKLFADYSHFTDVYPGRSNVFNTVRVQVLRNTTTILDTGDLRMSDLHTRKFLLYTNSGNLTLWLAPYRTNITGQSSFSNDPALTNKQVLSTALQGGDTAFSVRFTGMRHRDLNTANASYTYLDADELLSVTNDRPFYKGELASLCFNVGYVSPQMVRMHAEDFWRVQLRKQTNSSYAPMPDEYQGTAATIMGMSYFEQLGRAVRDVERLYKVRRLGVFDFGLAKLSSKTVNSVAKSLPIVDMEAYEAAVIANSTLRPDLGGDFYAAWEDADWQIIAQGSALEHRVINGFFLDTNAISTVKLLQLAQKRSGGGVAGIVQLYKQNYVTAGNTASAGYGGTLLKNYDPGIWSEVTNAFNNWDGDYVRVFITPAPQTNSGASYRGMGALIIGKEDTQAAIQQNLNGGWGSYEPDFSYSSGINYLDYSLGMGPDDSMYFNYNRGSSPLTFDSVSTYDTANFFGGGSSLFGTPDQQDTATQIGLQYGQSGSTFQSGYFTSGDSGYVGNPDWLSSWGTTVSEPVNPLTGEFYVDTGDLTLPGPFPLQVRRNYLSQNRAQNQFGVGWKWALTPYLVLTNSTQGAANALIYATEMDGAVVAYRRQGSTDVWKPQVSDNPSLNNNNSYGIGSTANILNAVIQRVITNSADVYFLTGADGSVRRYELKPYPITSGSTTLDRTRPYLTSWRDNRGNTLNFIYGQDGTAVNYGQVVRVESSNGNFVEFVYDSYARIVEAFTADGRHLSYAYDLYGDLVTVTLPDATEINYQYGRYNYTNSGTVYRDSNHLLTQELKFDGRQLINQYDSLRRVTNQLQTIGADLTPIRSVTFYYSNNYNPTNPTPLSGNTLIVDVFGKTNRYDYSNGEVTAITDPLGQSIQQQWYADNATVPGYPRSLQLRKDKRGLWTQFKYDTQGNITNMLQFTATGTDNLTGEAVNDATTTNAVWTALYTTNNLLQQTVDPAGSMVQLTYDPVFTWLPSKAVKLAGGTAVSTNLMFYYSVTNSITNGSLVYAQYAVGLLQREVRGGVATNEWQYDGRGFRTKETRYARTAEDSSNTDPAVVTTLVHDSRGELVEKDDALGRAMLFDFDAMGRPKWTEVYSENGDALARSYSYYNPNGELVWSTGPQMKPDNYVWRDYDGAGRKITEIVWRSEALADLSDVGPAWSDDLYAVSQFEYDSFGNQTKVIDPRGNNVVRRWDSLGRLTQEEFYGADNTGYATNKFGYEAGGLERFSTNALGAFAETRYTGAGKPRFRQNADGSTQTWTYYLDGRPRCEFLINGSYWTNIYQDSQRKLTRVFKKPDGTALATNIVEFDARGNTIRTTDGEGNVFVNSFDGLDRIRVAAGPSIQTVSYDPISGQSTTNLVQQSTTHIYDNCGQIDTVMNALGEKTVRRFDMLGRVERMDILNTNGASVRNSEFAYTADNHYVQAWEGTGATETYSESYLDHAGRAVLAVRYASASTYDPFTRVVKRFDKAGNLVAQQEDGDWYVPGGGLSAVTVVGTNGWTYDGLNRVLVETSRDGASTTNQYNAIGNAITRFLPGGLKYVAGYTPDGRMTNEYVLGSGTDRMNERGYGYFAAGTTFAGRLQSVSDTRGVALTNAYDDWGRVKTVGTAGSQAEYNTSTSYQYDRRGLMTQISRGYTNSATGPSTTISRSFDAYSQLASESVTVGSGGYSATPAWNSAGRRSGLSLSGLAPLSFGYRADGAMTSVSVNSYGAYGVNYTYGDNGLIYSRSDGTKTVNYTRDEMGRLTGSVIKFGSTTNLTESLTWRSDTRLLQAVEKRSTFTDTRSYQYAGWSRFLTNEQYYVSSGTMDTQDYQFDQGGKGGLGVLTGAADWDAASSGGLDTLKRPVKGTTTYSRMPAFGKAFGAASVSATLNGQPVAVDFTKGNSNGWFYAQLLPQSGTNILAVTAVHPSNLYSNTSTSIFTNNATSDTVTNLYDSFGNVTRRVWRKASGGLVRQQDFTWNAFNQLVKLSERDANNSGFDWTGAFDGLGRRLRVTETQVISNTPSASVSSTDSYYDPAVEFLELGVSYNGRVEMKVFGPDLSCGYGGAQGIGGLEAVVDVASGSKNTVLNDRFGNVLGYAPVMLPSSFQWSAARFHSCGPKVGYETPFLASGVSLVQTLGWQGQRRDLTGLYYWNARPYDPMERRWLTIDPVGISNMLPYGYCGGDPNYWLDPDGRSLLGEIRTDTSALFSSTFWGGMGQSLYGTGARTVNGVVQAGAIGSDMIGQSAASLFGYGADYQGYSHLYQSIYNNPSAGPSGGHILLGTLKTEANIATLGYASVLEGTYHAADTGDYRQLQDSFTGIALAGGAAWAANKLGPISYRGEYPTSTPEGPFTRGIQPAGGDMDLIAHAQGNANSGYVPTSQSLDVATDFAGGARGLNGPVYEAQSWRGIDVNAELGARSPVPGDLETAFPGGIYGSDITGFYTKVGGQLTGDFTSNPYFGLNGTYAGSVGLFGTAGSCSTPLLGKKGH
jgi:RHS repeat-associated protein